MFERLLNQMKDVFQALLDDDDFSQLNAKLMKKNYDALLEVGFTPDQAIQIVAAQGSGVNASS